MPKTGKITLVLDLGIWNVLALDGLSWGYIGLYFMSANLLELHEPCLALDSSFGVGFSMFWALGVK